MSCSENGLKTNILLNLFYFSLQEDAALRANKNYRIIETRKDGIKFTSDKLDRYNEQFYSLNTEYEEQQKSVVDDILRIAGKTNYLQRIC